MTEAEGWRIVITPGTDFAAEEAKRSGIRAMAWINKPAGGYIPIHIHPDQTVTIHNDGTKPMIISIEQNCADGSGAACMVTVKPNSQIAIDGMGFSQLFDGNNPTFPTQSASAVLSDAQSHHLIPESSPADLSVFSDDAWAARLANTLGISKKKAKRQIKELRAAARKQKEMP